MTIDKAIEILTQYTKGTDMLYLPDFLDALKLGIEALKRVQLQRGIWGMKQDALLPGETED